MRGITNDRMIKAIISSGRRRTISPTAPSRALDISYFTVIKFDLAVL